MMIEYLSCVLAAILVLTVYALASYLAYTPLKLYTSLLTIILGASMIFLGFWGSDAAFVAVLGGQRTVDVAFMRAYTPIEWWNLNWFITCEGSALLALGMFVLGQSVEVKKKR